MDSLRKRIADFIGFAPDPERPTAQVVERHAQIDYTRSLVRYTVADGDLVDAFLFEPTATSASRTGVLVFHQHNSQWAIGKSEVAGLVGDSLQAFGPKLARRGIVVLAPDSVGFESRLDTAHTDTSLAPALTKPGGSPEGWLQYYNQMAHRLVYGDLLIRKVVADCVAAVSVLQGFTAPEARIGAIGHSMGGNLVLFLGALDPRVAFTCSSGAVCSYRYKQVRGIGLEFGLVIPGFARQFEVVDLLRCIAPRPVLVVSADGDPNSGDAADVVSAARGTFEALGASQCLAHLHVGSGHALDLPRFDAILDWTMRQVAAG